MKKFSIQLKLITQVKERFFISGSCEKGYALPVVLVVSLVIVALTLAISFSLRSKISIATEIKDRTQASLQTYSAINEVFYHILTAPITHTGLVFEKTDMSPAGLWNFFGEPFSLSSGTTIQLRDLSGMVSLPFGGEQLHRLINKVASSPTKASQFYSGLMDWQDANDLKRLNGAEAFEYKDGGHRDKPRNFYIQTLDEIELIKGYDSEIFDQIKPDLTYWSSGAVNPLLMSENLLRTMILDDTAVDQILRLRKEGSLTGSIFESLSGFADTGSNYYWPSGWIKVTVYSKVGSAVDSLETIIVKRQTEQNPFHIIMWQR